MRLKSFFTVVIIAILLATSNSSFSQQIKRAPEGEIHFEGYMIVGFADSTTGIVRDPYFDNEHKTLSLTDIHLGNILILNKSANLYNSPDISPRSVIILGLQQKGTKVTILSDPFFSFEFRYFIAKVKINKT